MKDIPYILFTEDMTLAEEKTRDEKNRKIHVSDYCRVDGLQLIAYSKNETACKGVPPHRHPDAIEFNFTLKGGDVFRVNGEDYSLSIGDVLITQPEDNHFSANYCEGVKSEIWFQLNLKSDTFLNLPKESGELIKERLRNLKNPLLHIDNDTLAVVKKLFYSCYEKADLFEQLALLNYILLKVFEAYDRHNSGQICTNSQSAQINEYILAHYTENISIESICEQNSISRSRLYQLFDGQSPIDHINRLRVEYAKKLLAGYDSITEIAFRSGFESSSYFSSIFKKYTNFSPSEYSIFLSKND